MQQEGCGAAGHQGALVRVQPGCLVHKQEMVLLFVCRATRVFGIGVGDLLEASVLALCLQQ